MEPVLPKARFLDPRSEEAAASAPIAEAANIPWESLRTRRAELPPPGEPVAVADTGPEARMAAVRLRELGYEAILASDWVWTERPMAWRLWEPNPMLVPCPRPAGRALDLGCGAGRDAVWLAAHGWQVVGLDRLPEALLRAEELARRCRVSAKTCWVEADLRRPRELPRGPFDLLLAFLCRHWRLAVGWSDRLAQGGSLMLEAFAEGARRPGVTATPEAVAREAARAGLVAERIELGSRGGSATVRALLRRP
ncbi:MAG: class I SAM-dependent methyltransferase [Fimbriimonadales bacterium]|nr:class I SAM-dependent methyltransferase [Fimbriimonadales bacterium]